MLQINTSNYTTGLRKESLLIVSSCLDHCQMYFEALNFSIGIRCLCCTIRWQSFLCFELFQKVRKKLFYDTNILIFFSLFVSKTIYFSEMFGTCEFFYFKISQIALLGPRITWCHCSHLSSIDDNGDWRRLHLFSNHSLETFTCRISDQLPIL